MVAHRFETEPEVDSTIDYVFTFRLAPTKVRLRLMKRPGGRRSILGLNGVTDDGGDDRDPTVGGLV